MIEDDDEICGEEKVRILNGPLMYREGRIAGFDIDRDGETRYIVIFPTLLGLSPGLNFIL